MSLPRTGARALAAACALTLLVAACGGDDDSAETTDAPATEESTTTAEDDGATTTEDDGATTTEEGEEEEPEQDAEALALAESVNLTIDEIAEGWTEEPPDEDDEEGDLDDCFTSVELAQVELASAESNTFRFESPDGGIQGIATKTTVVDEAASGEAVMADTATNAFAGCALDALIASFEEDGITVVDADLNPAPEVENVADETTGLNGAFSLEGEDGEALPGEVSLFFVRTDTVVTAVSVFDLGLGAVATTLDEAVAAVGQKHAAEIG